MLEIAIYFFRVRSLIPDGCKQLKWNVSTIMDLKNINPPGFEMEITGTKTSKNKVITDGKLIDIAFNFNVTPKRFL